LTKSTNGVKLFAGYKGYIMKFNYRILSRGAVACALPLLMAACGRKDNAGAARQADVIEARIDSVLTLRNMEHARLDSCVARANAALESHNAYADRMDLEYRRFVDSKYMLSKYFSPADLDLIHDTADNWLSPDAQKTDEYKRIAIDRGTLLDAQSLFANYVNSYGIDPCRKELAMILEFHQKADGTYETRFVDSKVNTQCMRQMADYLNMAAYRDSRDRLTDNVRSIADSASVIRSRVSGYDAKIKELRNRLVKVREGR